MVERLREVFPDCALLPRRGSARRPPAGVHPDRSGDVVPAAGAHLRSDRAADAAGLRSGRISRRKRRSRASPTPRPCAATAATSRTCASRRCTRWRTCCPDLANAGLPLVAIHIPGTGAPSRKERDELKAFGQERGLRVYDDAKRLERDYPGSHGQGPRAHRRAAKTTCWCWPPGPASPRATVPKRPSTRPAASCACTRAQKFNDRHKLLDPKNFQFLWVVDFPMFEWDEEENRWNAAHHPFTSVHDEDLEKLTDRPGALPRQVVRPGAERRRNWARAPSVFTAATCRRRSSPRWA